MILKDFDFSTFHDNPVVVIYGKRSCGKTTLINNIIDCKNMRNNFTVFNYKHGEYTDAREEYNDDQYLQYDKKINEIIKNKNNYKNRDNYWVILDNMELNLEKIKTQPFKLIFMNGRCLKLGLFITFQYPLILPPSYRTNIDYVFVFKHSANIRIIWDMYFKMIEDYNEFLQIVEDAGTCLILDNTTNMIFKYT
jgi:uridine kinase